jgi:hypothetical protein
MLASPSPRAPAILISGNRVAFTPSLSLQADQRRHSREPEIVLMKSGRTIGPRENSHFTLILNFLKPSSQVNNFTVFFQFFIGM